jgi:hypothetical protein
MDSPITSALSLAGDPVSKPDISKTAITSVFVASNGKNMPVTTIKPAFLKFGFDEDTESPDMTPETARFGSFISNDAPLKRSNGNQPVANYAPSEADTERGFGTSTALPTELRHFTFAGTTYFEPVPSLDYYEPPFVEAFNNQSTDNLRGSSPGTFHGHFRHASYNSVPGDFHGHAIEGFYSPAPEAFHDPHPEAGSEQGFGTHPTQMGSPYAVPGSRASPYRLPNQISSPLSMSAQVFSPDQTTGNPPFHTDGYRKFTAPVPFSGQPLSNGSNANENSRQVSAVQFFNPVEAGYHNTAPDLHGRSDATGFVISSPTANATDAYNGFSSPGEIIKLDCNSITQASEAVKEAWMCTCSCGCRMRPEDEGDSHCWWCDFNPGHDGYGKGPMLGPRPQ